MVLLQIKSALELVLAGSGIKVNIATAADKFNGDTPNTPNTIVNRLANGNGIQIRLQYPFFSPFRVYLQMKNRQVVA